MRCAIVIPARMASTRFPRKPLCDLAGKPMVQWVYEACMGARIADRVLVATPDDEIVQACHGFGAPAILTRADHPSGTDRIAEVAAKVDAEVLVNVQGDEPLVRAADIEACARPLLVDPTIGMASLCCPCPEEDLNNPAVVKVVVDLRGYAIYFSRHPIPYPRNSRVDSAKKHLGLYAYRRDVVMAFAGWPPTPLERTESLEQLRFLEHGVSIFMADGVGSELAVDTPEQAEQVRGLLAVRQPGP